MYLEHHTYTGGVFSDSLPDGRSGAEVTLSPSSVVAKTTDGETFEIAFRDCRVEIGGFSGRMVFCRNEDQTVTIFCEEKSFPTALAHSAGGLLDEQLKTETRKQRSGRRRSWISGVFWSVLIGFALVGGYYGLMSGARVAVMALPVSVDQKLGDAAFHSMDLGGTEIEDQVIVDAITTMVERLAPHAALEGIEFDVHLVDSDTVNAFALPGGNIVIYTGLINRATTAEQVAGVLAHEMAHVTKRHGLEQISRSLGIYTAVTVLVGDATGLIAAGAELFQLASINNYSQAMETEADEEGARMMHEAGLDPNALAEFFAILKEEHGELPEVLSWISTHPDHDSRIDHIKILPLAPGEDGYETLEIDWQSVQNAAS